MLIQHADRILTAIHQVLNKTGRPRTLKSTKKNHDGSSTHHFVASVPLGVKLAGVHWWFKTRSHAAELTAGYYNTETRDGYAPIMDVVQRHNALLSFTCVEMRDCEHPPESMCSPQGLLKQVIAGARRANIPLSGENALQRYARARIRDAVCIISVCGCLGMMSMHFRGLQKACLERKQCRAVSSKLRF